MNEDTRTRILLAAGEAFAELGFEATTIREICRRAEVNLAAVNYHFGDKEKLYAETFKYALRFKAEQMPVPDWPAGTPPETKLRDFVRTTILRMMVAEELPWQARLMMREMLMPTEVCRAIADDHIRPHFNLLLSILDEVVPAETPQHRRHQLGFSVMGQIMLYKFHEPIVELLIPSNERKKYFAPAKLADHIADVILAALGRQQLFDTSRTRNRVASKA